MVARVSCLAILAGLASICGCSSDSRVDSLDDVAVVDTSSDVATTDTALRDGESDDASLDSAVDPGTDTRSEPDVEDVQSDIDSEDADAVSSDTDELDTTAEDTQLDQDTGTPSNAELALADCVTMHEEFCARLYTFDCGPNNDAYRPQMEEFYGISDEASCMAVVMPEACELVVEPYRRGYQLFEAEVAAECRSNMFTLPCDAFFGFDPHVSELADCGDFIVGLQEEGEKCFEDYSCVDGLYCPDLSVNRVLESEDELGTCVPPRGDGEVCQFNDQHCQGALVCDGRLCGPAE